MDKFHPAMKHAIGPRKEIGQRTIFNILGPLTNPAGAQIQLTGVFDPNLTEPLAQVLNELGSKAALVIHGANGLDELNTTGTNRVSHLKDGAVKTYDLDPTELGLAQSTVADLRGGTPDESAVMMRDLLSNNLNGARCDAVLLNTAATESPGSPRESNGIIAPEVDAVFAASGAATPFTSPSPNISPFRARCRAAL
jgi:anthranilate phosphoribosyltransferase